MDRCICSAHKLWIHHSQITSHTFPIQLYSEPFDVSLCIHTWWLKLKLAQIKSFILHKESDWLYGRAPALLVVQMTASLFEDSLKKEQSSEEQEEKLWLPPYPVSCFLFTVTCLTLLPYSYFLQLIMFCTMSFGLFMKYSQNAKGSRNFQIWKETIVWSFTLWIFKEPSSTFVNGFMPLGKDSHIIVFFNGQIKKNISHFSWDFCFFTDLKWSLQPISISSTISELKMQWNWAEVGLKYFWKLNWLCSVSKYLSWIELVKLLILSSDR